jgi:hypothetical protein
MSTALGIFLSLTSGAGIRATPRRLHLTNIPTLCYNVNTMLNSLLRSRKFILTCYTLLQTIVLHYLSLPTDVIAAMDAVVLALIAGIALEDAGYKAGADGLLVHTEHAWRALLRSRKFLLAVYALVQTLALHYLALPADIIWTLDAVIITLITTIALEDAAQKTNNNAHRTT